MDIIDKNAQRVLDFWFNEHNIDNWFSVNTDFDNKIKAEFSNLHLRAIIGEFHVWRNTPKGALAEIIILDQFSRNIYRNDIRSFVSDEAALILSQSFINHNFDRELSIFEKLFAYIPFMHSEKLDAQKKSLELFSSLDNEKIYQHAVQHHDIIVKFGRFPHRNTIMKRQSSDEEMEYLKQFPTGF